MNDWDNRFMELALRIAQWSKDSTKVGCIIVGPDNEIRSTGYHGLPRGADDTIAQRRSGPAKYLWTEHAERNAIYNAALAGISLKDCRIYVPWFPCMDCARAIVQVGIRELIAIVPDLNHPRWGEGFKTAQELLYECNVQVRYVEFTIPDSLPLPGVY
jgi:dCMP deaminase